MCVERSCMNFISGVWGSITQYRSILVIRVGVELIGWVEDHCFHGIAPLESFSNNIISILFGGTELSPLDGGPANQGTPPQGVGTDPELLHSLLRSCVWKWSLFFFFFFFVFLGPHLLHMEVPRLGVKLELQLPAYTTATATQGLSCLCSLHHSSLATPYP